MAFRCFFGLLFGGKLPGDASAFLPATARAALEAPKAEAKSKTSADAKDKPAAKPAADKAAETAKPDAGKAAKPAADKAAETVKKSADVAQYHRDGALSMLALLQREGRLVDFLREPLDQFEDADIGAAARDVHRGCKKVLDDYFALEPAMPGDEDDTVTVPKGFDPSEVRLIGDTKGEPPFKGTLRHPGWRATEIKLPTLSEGVDRTIIAPAEVELK